MTHDLLELAEECENKLLGLAVIRAVAPQLGNTCDELTLTLSKIYATLPAAHEEIERLRDALKGKHLSHDVTTICECEDCGSPTRWGRHLDMDCKTIARLRKAIQNAPHELLCNTSSFGKWDTAIKDKKCNCWKSKALGEQK